MDANKREWVESDLVYKVTGCGMAVLNELGHGLRDKTYERALCLELELRDIIYERPNAHPIYYKNNHIDDYIPDLEVERRLIVETKTVESICQEHIGQVINYLRITGFEAGLILNFKHPKLQWKKIVLQEK